ncbi:MAG: ABC transporter permease [Candidatus Bipolaricaulaceae bacterium]
MWLLIPLRNLARNRRRTLLSGSVVGLGTAVALLVLGFVEQSRELIQQSTVQQFGNLQIGAESLWAGTVEGYDYLMGPKQLEGLRQVVEGQPGVVATSAQLSFPGLLTVGRSTKVVQATGVVPENSVSGYDESVIDGRPLQAGDQGSVLVGRALAEELDLAPGVYLNFTVTTVDGAFNVAPMRVVGVYRFTSAEVERRQVFVPLSFGQRLLDTDGADRLVVRLADLSLTARVAGAVERQLQGAESSLEVRTWDELSPFYRQLSGFFDILFGFLVLAVLVLVFFILLQVLTLAFLERTREVGTVRALGTKRGQVFRMFLVESTALGVVGAGAGLGVGWLLGLAFNAASLPWQPPGTVEPVSLGVKLSGTTLGIPFAASVLATAISGILPAVQSTRIRVADALRSR